MQQTSVKPSVVSSEIVQRQAKSFNDIYYVKTVIEKYGGHPILVYIDLTAV
jgi:hypothetical protein